MNEFFASDEAWARSQGIATQYLWMALGACLVIALGKLFGRRSSSGVIDLTPQSAQTAPRPPTRHAFATDTARAVPRLDLAPEVTAQIFEHLRAGDKIRAIKALRQATGLGLAEAKSCVDALERR